MKEIFIGYVLPGIAVASAFSIFVLVAKRNHKLRMAWYEADAAVDDWLLRNPEKAISEDNEGRALIQSAINAWNSCFDAGGFSRLEHEATKRFGWLRKQVY